MRYSASFQKQSMSISAQNYMAAVAGKDKSWQARHYGTDGFRKAEGGL